MIDQIAEFFTFSHIMLLIYLLNAVIAFGLIFIDTKSPAATMAWIMVLFLIPVLGLVLYLILSQNIARQQIFKMTEDEAAGMDSLLDWQKESVRTGIKTSSSEITDKWRSMITMNLDYADSLLTDNSSVELIYDGQEMFNRLCNDIENAKYTIRRAATNTDTTPYRIPSIWQSFWCISKRDKKHQRNSSIQQGHQKQ